MIKRFTLLAVLFAMALTAAAQHTFVSGWNSFEISGYVIGFYQFRPTFKGDPNAGDYHKNTFDLDDARINFKGYVKGRFKYEVEANLAGLADIAINGLKDIKSNPLTEANIQYINPIVNVEVGYFKVPFSASSITDKVPSPYLQRTAIADGDYFSRRDVGIMLHKDLWHQRINIYAAIVSGVGEQILLGDGDRNGRPEYIARIELSSSYYRDEELDKKDLALPLARICAAIRYNDKTAFTGNGTADYALDNVKTVDGKKISYNIDAGFMWHGFSAQFEMDRGYMRARSGTPLASQLSQYNTGYFTDGGLLVQANYYNKFLKSAISVRYDEFNPSDLVEGIQQRTLGVAYNFIFSPYNLTLKLHYAYRFKQQATGIKWTEDQLRAGVQYTF